VHSAVVPAKVGAVAAFAALVPAPPPPPPLDKRTERMVLLCREGMGALGADMFASAHAALSSAAAEPGAAGAHLAALLPEALRRGRGRPPPLCQPAPLGRPTPLCSQCGPRCTGISACSYNKTSVAMPNIDRY
jgi:hypothetical protein